MSVILAASDHHVRTAPSMVVGDIQAVVAYSPVEALQADTTYHIVITGDEAATLAHPESMISGLERTFTTGSVSDHEPPPVPVATVDAANSGSDEDGESQYASFDVEWSGVILLADLDESSELQMSPPAGQVSELSLKPEIAIGSNSCLSSWPGAEDGSVGSVRFASFDTAGNFSGWSDPVEVELPSCGCSTAGGSATGILPMLALLLLVSNLRPRRASTSRVRPAARFGDPA